MIMKIINKYLFGTVILLMILAVVACTGGQGLKEGTDGTKGITDDFEQNQVGLSLEEADSRLLAYQLELQMRSSFKTAYQSWLNLSRIAEDDNNLEQISSVLHATLAGFVVESQIEEELQKLKDINKGGEGEVSFPTHEVVNNIEVKENNSDEVQVMITATRYYPASEWAGEKYNKEFNYVVTLLNENNTWMIKKVGYQ